MLAEAFRYYEGSFVGGFFPGRRSPCWGRFRPAERLVRLVESDGGGVLCYNEPATPP